MKSLELLAPSGLDLVVEAMIVKITVSQINFKTIDGEECVFFGGESEPVATLNTAHAGIVSIYTVTSEKIDVNIAIVLCRKNWIKKSKTRETIKSRPAVPSHLQAL